MFKKFFSLVVASSLLAMLMPANVFAVEPIISDVGLLIMGSNQYVFSPSKGDSLGISVFTSTAYNSVMDTATGTVKILDSSNKILKTYDAAPFGEPDSNGHIMKSYDPWNGLNGSTPYPNGLYKVKADITLPDSVPAGASDSMTKEFYIGEPPETDASITVLDTPIDFSEDGDNEVLKVEYDVSGHLNSLMFSVFDSRGENLENKTINSPASSGTINVWDGIESGHLTDPGTYTLKLFADGSATPSATKTFEVDYDDSDKPNIEDEDVNPDSFDKEDEFTEISFSHDEDADVWVEIQDLNGNVIRKFSDYKGDDYDAGDEHVIEWNGEKTSGTKVTTGHYKVYIRCENSSGVDVEYLDVEVTYKSVSTNYPSSNSHIGGIDFDPSSTFEPSEDDELVIEYDVKRDLDELQVYAVRGSTKIELEDEDDVDKENNLEITWDGTDEDDEYVDDGTWDIRFESSVGSQNLVAEKSIKLKFDDPKIDDFELSKDEIDTEIGESTFIIFRIDKDAEVDILVYEDGDKEDEIEEDMEVEGDKWYAVEWDGDGYDNNDDDKDIEIKLVAKTIGGKQSDSEKRDIEFKEDDVSSSKSNITKDYVSPAIADSGDDVSFFFELEDDADVTMTIRKGDSSSGKELVELLDDVDLDGDEYEIKWDGKDDDGDKLKDGFYTYKIVSKDKSTETETGIFAIGEIGDEDTTKTTSQKSKKGKISSNVKIVSGNEGVYSKDYGDCGGYSDVSDHSDACEAISWGTEKGIFKGYKDGTFKPYKAINRAEVLKVLFEGLDVDVLPIDGTTSGFNDVDAFAWYMPYIKTAKAQGIFSGDGKLHTARPAVAINRAELLKLVFETLRAQNGYSIGVCSGSYSDIPNYAWYKDYACEAKNYGLFNSSLLHADELSSREEVAQLLYDLHLAGLI